ncbi:MAG TPA: amidohydrolase family protein [Bacteroidota bacterium]|nr:amidohydrolase family protein [Bacteroidota bacterium]
MKKNVALAALLLGAGVLLYLLLSRPGDASMILVNGVIYTLDERKPVASAVAIRGDRIVAVGSDSEIRSSFHADSTIDLGGRPVYPGFIDSHAHIEGLGAALMNLDVAGAPSEEEAASRVGRAVHDTVNGGWIRGRGWDQNLWPGKAFPTRFSLDRVSGGIPVILTRVDGHAVWVNTRALEIAGITGKTPDVPGGRILRSEGGEPTGVFVDNAMDAFLGVVPPPSEAERTEAVRRAVDVCIASGLTEVHDMGVDSGGVAIYKNLIAAGKFPFRVYAAISGSSAGFWAASRKAGPLIGWSDGRLTVRAVKFYADGALGSRGAALLEPYSDDPGNRGLTLLSRSVLVEAAEQALDAGFQICTHAIGDRANAFVLDAYAEALTARSAKGHDVRFRVEHAQVLAPSDIPRFNALGVIPTMQATHCTSDMPWAPDRLGPSRIKGAYAWRSLIRQGSIIPGGSDFPVESPNPLWGFYAAITRQDRDGQPPGGWNPGERMTREEALRSYTIWGAFAGFQEREKGSIEPGKWADLVVLTDDIMKIDPPKILTTRVEKTIIAGEVVYSAPGTTGGASH